MRPGFAGVDHMALTVTDLATSQRFYTEILGFVAVMDVGTGRICMHPETGFVLALLTHEGAPGGPFSELNTGVDHIGFLATSRQELEQWEQHFRAAGIALKFTCSSDLMIAAQNLLATGNMTAADIAAFVSDNVSPDLVVKDLPEA